MVAGSALKEERRLESGGGLAAVLSCWVVSALDFGGMLAASVAAAEGDRFGETENLEARSAVSAPAGCCWRWELPASLVPEALSN